MGREEIRRAAPSTPGWDSGADLELTLAFGDGGGSTPVTGGVFQIAIQTPGGGDCQLSFAALLQAEQGLITRERPYYDGDSLAECGFVE